MGRPEGCRQSEPAGHHRHDPGEYLAYHRCERQTPKQPMAVQWRRDVVRRGGSVSLPYRSVLPGHTRQNASREHLLSLRDWIQCEGNSAENLHANSRIERTVASIQSLTPEGKA